jgi:uncharacterized protein
MPSVLRHPGVYIEELESSVRPIAGVSTSNTAFIGFFLRGPRLKPTKVTSFAEFEQLFGGFDARTEAAYQVDAYFANGGSVAWIVRTMAGTPAAATKTFNRGSDTRLKVTASSEGGWGENLNVTINKDGVSGSHFNLKIEEIVNGEAVAVEDHNNITLDDAEASSYGPHVVNRRSRLVQVEEVGTASSAPDNATREKLLNGDDGTLPDANAWGDALDALPGIASEIFNILCLAGAGEASQTGALNASQYSSLVNDAGNVCEDNRAFLIVDPPDGVEDLDDMTTSNAYPVPSVAKNAAIYFPRLAVPDPLQGGATRVIGASGTVAGVYARTDANRGVWKPPAGTDAAIGGATPLVELDDEDTGTLNVTGVNVIRSFPIYRSVVWGARTLDGADAKASQWKYVSVRRMALYIEESLNQGLKWVVFEPNDDPLWSSIRLNVGAFMNGLYRQGAFAGIKPSDAYFVKCDKDTTTQADVDRGVCNILVGFSPLKPAEFVVLKIQQMAGQAEA